MLLFHIYEHTFSCLCASLLYIGQMIYNSLKREKGGCKTRSGQQGRLINERSNEDSGRDTNVRPTRLKEESHEKVMNRNKGLNCTLQTQCTRLHRSGESTATGGSHRSFLLICAAVRKDLRNT